MIRFLSKKLLLFFLFFLTINSAKIYAQEDKTCSFRGTLIDSLGLPISDASVTAFNKANESAGYTFSDLDGIFKLELPCPAYYELEIEHITHESFVAKVDLNKNTSKKYILKTQSIDLAEALIEARRPITIKGDTIEFDAESFKTGTEENLEDIIKRLPGFEVEDGKVFYQGKEINTIKVEGREVFGGNTKLLNKNLPSDAVDLIQLQSKMKKNPFANSLQDDEQPELNIILKEDSKNLIFGNLRLGGDADTHWDAQEKLFYFDSTKDGTLISDYNTFGKEVFTRDDYFSFLGGISELQDEGGTLSLRNSLTGLNLGNSREANEMSEALSAVHVGYEPNKKVYANAFAMVDRNQLFYRTISDRQNLIANQRQVDVQDNSDEIFTAFSRFRVDYMPRDKTQLKYRLNLTYQNSENRSDIQSTIDGVDAGGRDVLSDRDNYQITQKFTWREKVGKDDNLGVYVTHQMQFERPDWFMDSNIQPFNQIDGVQEIDGVFNLVQNQKMNNNSLQTLGIYNHLLSRTSNLRISFGANFNWQILENDMFTFNDRLTDSGLQADSDFNYSEIYTDLNYTKKIGDLKIDVGASLYRYAFDNNAILNDADITKTEVLPHLDLRYEFSSTSGINFSYERAFVLPNIRDLSEATLIQSYTALFAGNSNLSPALTDRFNLNFNKFKATSFLNLYAGLTFEKRRDNLRNFTQQSGLASNSTLINSVENETFWSSYAGMSKRFSRHYQLRYNFNGSISDFFTINQNVLFDDMGNATGTENLSTENRSINQTHNLRNIFKIAKKLEVTLGFRFNRSVFESTNSARSNENIFNNYTPNVEMAWAISKKLLLQGNYDYNLQYQNGEQLNDLQDLSASLRWKMVKKVNLYLTAGNLLNNDQLVNSFFGDINNTVNTTQILGRYILGSIRYKF